MTSEDDARSSPIKFFFPLVSAQPANAIGVIGGQASFTAAFTSTNPAIVTFLWQIQTDGATWTNLVETAGVYEGVATLTLTVKAIDNFLATRTSLNFRCRALFANAVPSFTNPAALSIPIHTDFPTDVGISARAQLVGGTLSIGYNPGPQVFGFAGPYTYQWTYVSGENSWTPGVTTNRSFGVFNFNVQPGWTVAFWKCTITNGTDTVATDPLPFVTYGAAPPGATTLLTNSTTPLSSANGAALSATTFDQVFFAPWTVGLQTNLRFPTAAVVTIDSPNAEVSSFTLPGSASQPGGTGVFVYVGLTMQVVSSPTDYWQPIGTTLWQK